MLANLYSAPEAPNNPIWAKLGATGTGTATTVRATAQNLQGQPFFVGRVGFALTGGAAQYATRWRLYLFDASLTSFADLDGGEFAQTTAALPQNSKSDFGMGFILPPKWAFALDGFYNAGANSNTTNLTCMGWYIPRGNLSLP